MEEAHMRLAAGVPFTFVHVAFYFENFIQGRPTGNYGFGFPLADARSQLWRSTTLVVWVTAIFENRAEFLGETVEIVGDQMTAQEVCPNYVCVCCDGA